MAQTILQKLNHKSGHALLMIQAPDEVMARFELPIHTQIETVFGQATSIVFVKELAQIEHWAPLIAAAFPGDDNIWFAYPKGTSKRHTCNFNRDNGWEALGELGFEPVRQIAIDEDWSALRFRRFEHIKTFTRSFALTEKGKMSIKKE